MSVFRPLHDGWTVAPAAGPAVPADFPVSQVPAAVPGCVHTDLLAAGRIPDPYLDDNETALGWIGHADWVYETAFEWDATSRSRVDLACAGLDTVATVFLNGAELGTTANMHRSYRFDARPHLRTGENRLRVHFGSAYRYAEEVRAGLGDRPNAYPDPFNFVRKMACNFGWDWGPNVVTAGIWQPIGLHSWDTARLAAVRPLATVADGVGRVAVHVEVERESDEPLSVSAAVTGFRAETTIAPGERTAVVTVEVRDPELWWPRGYGEQVRHLLDVTLRSAGGDAVDTWQRRIGFRSVRLDTTADAHGTPFTLVVNGVPVFARGVNWIPDDTFVTRMTRERYAERFAQAIAANVNLLRVWGGGRYESEEFYDLADELGLLVAQDFLFACAAYPEEEPIASEVVAEAREQVARLASHPSLVAWFGSNENIWGFHDWGWPERLAGRTWGEGYYLEVLPAIVAELDPTRPYWPSSPYSGPSRHPNEPAHGSMHIWDVWNEKDYVHYRDYRPRFVAEFGYQGPPVYATLRRAISDEPLAHDSPGMLHHQKAIDGDAKLQRGLDAHLPAPHDFDDWHYLTQVNQARAVAVGVEHFRSLRPLCMGTVVWQLNDCWPVTSWAAIDGDGRRKPLWYSLRRAYADRLLTIQPRDGELVLVAVNDGAEPWQGTAAVTRLAVTGEGRAKTAIELDVPPRRAVTLPLPGDVAGSEDPSRELVLADADGLRAWWFFAEDKDIAYPAPEYEATAEPLSDGWRVTVRAGTILRDLALFPDRLDPSASVDELMVTLLPGESATFTVTARPDLDPAALTARPVLRCVNDVQPQTPGSTS
ncbi:glycoside hydrolase family 2 protein [Phytohabitans kaempferiae]|uniref:beta-mannosidase n=1 Tax=Phytohabitans kaempferiae TaxID=1620943 RepID=A0ABV6M6G5_9ACTN